MITDNRFSVVIADNRLKIISVGGLSMQRSLVESRSGDDRNEQAALEIGQSDTPHIVLRRYLDSSDATFYDWYRDIRTPTRDVTVMLLNNNHEPIVVWDMGACLPVRLTYSELTADIAEHVIEELEIACGGMQIRFI